jgi:hypothetical protein
MAMNFDPRLLNLLHHPETARDWLDYVSRFGPTPFPPRQDQLNETVLFDVEWLVMGVDPPDSAPQELCLLSWMDLWVLFCLTTTTDMPMSRAVEGPDGGWDLAGEFAVRRSKFGL